MGIDLTLLPIDGDRSWWLSYNRLATNRDYELQKVIQENVNTLPADGKRVEWYDDDGIKEVKTDPYGTPLRYTTAGELAKVPLPPNLSRWNRAVFKFLKELLPDTPVVLWWH